MKTIETSATPIKAWIEHVKLEPEAETQLLKLASLKLARTSIMMYGRWCTAEYRDLLKTSPLVINCHHNYSQIENHFGKAVWVTRKGAVSARKGKYGIIPGSMGDKSYIVRGKGNPESFCSCSHGAGRKMSRAKAKKIFSLKDLQKLTEGIECRKDKGVLDEIPSAYKNIDDVMKSQEDLVEAVYTLNQVICVKG